MKLVQAIQTNFSNFLGDHKCLCDAGYTGDGEVVCTDIDECALGYHNCAPVGGICKNTPGHHECDGCLDGYTGNGVFCDDVDECVTGEIGEIFCTQVSPRNAVLTVSIKLSRRSVTIPLFRYFLYIISASTRMHKYGGRF